MKWNFTETAKIHRKIITSNVERIDWDKFLSYISTIKVAGLNLGEADASYLPLKN